MRLKKLMFLLVTHALHLLITKDVSKAMATLRQEENLYGQQLGISEGCRKTGTSTSDVDNLTTLTVRLSTVN
jgi:hypothetical protein